MCMGIGMGMCMAMGMCVCMVRCAGMGVGMVHGDGYMAWVHGHEHWRGNGRGNGRDLRREHQPQVNELHAVSGEVAAHQAMRRHRPAVDEREARAVAAVAVPWAVQPTVRRGAHLS